MDDAEFEAAILGAVGVDWIDGFKAGWQESGEGFNGEYPDEGRPWDRSAGKEAMLRVILERLREVP